MGRDGSATPALSALPRVGVVPAPEWGIQAACYMLLLIHAEIASVLCEEQRQIFHFQVSLVLLTLQKLVRL